MIDALGYDFSLRPMRLHRLILFLAVFFGIVSVLRADRWELLAGYEMEGSALVLVRTDEETRWLWEGSSVEGMRLVALDPRLHSALVETEGQRRRVFFEKGRGIEGLRKLEQPAFLARSRFGTPGGARAAMRKAGLSAEQVAALWSYRTSLHAIANHDLRDELLRTEGSLDHAAMMRIQDRLAALGTLVLWHEDAAGTVTRLQLVGWPAVAGMTAKGVLEMVPQGAAEAAPGFEEAVSDFEAIESGWTRMEMVLR